MLNSEMELKKRCTKGLKSLAHLVWADESRAACQPEVPHHSSRTPAAWHQVVFSSSSLALQHLTSLITPGLENPLPQQTRKAWLAAASRTRWLHQAHAA